MVERRDTSGGQPTNLTLEQIRRAIPRLEKRIAELAAFEPNELESRSSPEVTHLRTIIEQTLEDIFGRHTSDFRRYSLAANLDGGPLRTSSWSNARRGMPRQDADFRSHYRESRDRCIAILRSAVQSLNERAEELNAEVKGCPANSAAPEDGAEVPNSIFVVHGRDAQVRETVSRFLERLGFNAIVLHERPNKGRTLITKFREESAEVRFAVVIMTADDVGGEKGKGQSCRARQNVIFELGFFIGALGADRVAALVSSDVERPSDFDGVVYIPLEEDWRLPLCKELREAGYEVDLNKAI